MVVGLLALRFVVWDLWAGGFRVLFVVSLGVVVVGEVSGLGIAGLSLLWTWWFAGCGRCVTGVECVFAGVLTGL